jgi:tryptophan synthase alpha chain
MNRIQSLFKTKKERIFSVYCTAGFPSLEDTPAIITRLASAGADMIEIGIPFSDPLADGPTIQQSSARALANGMTVALLLEQLRDIRDKTAVPLVLMGYINPILQYGVERFCRQAAACGIDGFIIPDLPLDVYRKEWAPVMETCGLSMVFLVTPQTPEARIREIDRVSTGFIYMVTAAGTTGDRLSHRKEQDVYFTRLKQMGLSNPLMAGFGIRNRADLDHVCRYTQGGIVGSAFIQALQDQEEEQGNTIADFVQSFL